MSSLLFHCAALVLLSAGGAPTRTVTISEGTAAAEDGTRLHYLQAGDATSSRAVVFIPGWRLPASLWRAQMERLAPRVRVVAIDPRSQGPSGKATEGNSPEGRAADLHHVLAGLGITRPVLVGWSQGAQDVAAYVQAYGSDAVLGVALIDSPVSAGADEPKLHPVFSRIILEGLATYAAHPTEYSRGMVKSLFVQPHPELDLEALVQSTLQTPTSTGVAMLALDIFGADRRPGLKGLKRPALVVASARSPLLDEQKEMAASIPGSTLKVIEGAGHAVFIDQPKQFGDALDAFLQKL